MVSLDGCGRAALAGHGRRPGKRASSLTPRLQGLGACRAFHTWRACRDASVAGKRTLVPRRGRSDIADETRRDAEGNATATTLDR